MEEEKKKKKVLPRVFAGIGIFLLTIVLLIFAAFIYSGLDKKTSLSIFPHDYSVYIHTDSIWNTADSVLDLKVMDKILASPALADVRGSFMDFRSSELRNNKIIAKLASKSVDAAFYKNEDKYNFLACIDLGALSLASRLSPLIYKKFQIENLTRNNNFYIYDLGSSILYIKEYKNLVIVSDNLELLKTSVSEDFSIYSEEQLKLFNNQDNSLIKVIANVPELIDELGVSNTILDDIRRSFPEDSLSLISLNLTDEKIRLKVSVPVKVPEDGDYRLANILNKKSTNPVILSRFRENVQYYTIINIGNLEEIKNAIVPYFVNDLDKLWKTGDTASKTMFSLSLDDLLFSWTDSEIVMFGIQNRNNPVFAIQVSDEKQRQKVFDKLTSSIILKNNTSLILDGVRIPRLEIPVFIQDILKLFNVSLPNPYYLILDDFVYLSESAENLSDIYNAKFDLNQISQEKNWKTISQGISPEASISLFYNLQRSIPFFLKSNAMLSDILSLYQIGRCDLTIDNKSIILQLSAISNGENQSNEVPGFPVSLSGTVNGKLLSENLIGNKTALYWLENKKIINAMEIPSTAIKSFEAKDNLFIEVSKSKTDKNGGTLWAVTSYGEVYLLNRKLEVQEGFPILLGTDISLAPVADPSGVNIFSETGHLYHVDSAGEVSEKDIEITGSIKSEPVYFEDLNGNSYLGIYDKSFFGKILVLKHQTEEFSLNIPGIAYGSPAFLNNPGENMPYVSLVTQSGDVHIWNLNTNTESIVHLDGIFKIAPVSSDKYFFAVSTDGALFRIGLNGDVLEVKIPDCTCNEAFISVIDNNIYVCPDGNIIYGFDSDLELVYPFPMAGWGNPVFADIDGDNQIDCFRLSIDNKLFASRIK